MNRNRGVTLLEMLIVVALVAIVTSLAVPSFQNMIRQSQVTATSNELAAALITARNTAVRLDANVVVRPNGANWTNGWCVRRVAAAVSCDPSPDVYAVFDAPPSQVSFSGMPAEVVFRPSGTRFVPSAALPAAIAMTVCVDATCRNINVAASGLATVE